MFDENSSVHIIDDTKPLTASISSTENNGSYVTYHLHVYRGSNTDITWVVSHRYSDFASLNNQMQNWGVDLPFPKKKLFGNLDRAFIEDRKKALQVYIDVLLQHPLLPATFTVKQFFDPAHYSENFEEESLRQTSMLLRTEPHWKMIEPLKNIGGRIRKDFFLVNCETEVVGKQLLSWTEIGPYYSFNGKDMVSIIKTLTTVQHPYIVPVTLAQFNQNGAHISRPYHTAGSLRDLICNAKVKSHYVKKYTNPVKTFPENDIAVAGRQILEALVFLQDRGMPYGHLHSGNVVVDTMAGGSVYKITDLDNFILGLPNKYRHLHVQHGGIKTTQDADVYNFGLILLEMATATQLQTPTIDMIPATVPAALRQIIESILSTSAQKEGLPTLDDLIANIFFTPTTSTSHVQPVLKLSGKHKQAIAIATSFYETALLNDHKSLNQLRRQASAIQKSQSTLDKNKKRRRRQPSKGEQNTVSAPAPAPGAPAAPPPPPAPAPPPPPPSASTSNGTTGNEPATPAPPLPKSGNGKTALLSSIQGFSNNKLKKAATNDRSAPKV